MKIVNFFKDKSENRTQFFIVLGFIVLPVLAMIVVFNKIVLNDPQNTSQRLKLPPSVIEAQQSTTQP